MLCPDAPLFQPAVEALAAIQDALLNEPRPSTVAAAASKIDFMGCGERPSSSPGPGTTPGGGVGKNMPTLGTPLAYQRAAAADPNPNASIYAFSGSGPDAGASEGASPTAATAAAPDITTGVSEGETFGAESQVGYDSGAPAALSPAAAGGGGSAAHGLRGARGLGRNAAPCSQDAADCATKGLVLKAVCDGTRGAAGFHALQGL